MLSMPPQTKPMGKPPSGAVHHKVSHEQYVTEKQVRMRQDADVSTGQNGESAAKTGLKEKKLKTKPRQTIRRGQSTKQRRRINLVRKFVTHDGEDQDTRPSFNKSVASVAGKKATQDSHVARILGKDLSLRTIKEPHPPVPKLAHGLDRVLFNPGVYHVRDPRSRVYNFDPHLEKIMPVQQFDFDTLSAFTTASKDVRLAEIARRENKKFVGSTSSMTGVLKQFHFLLSRWRPINTSRFSRAFPIPSLNYTVITRAPSAIFLRYRDGVYAIDSDKGYDDANVLSLMGKYMEKLLTIEKDKFEMRSRHRSSEIPKEDLIEPEAYHYSTAGNMLIRSQLDAYDGRLPGSGMFDLKTRAVLPIRMDTKDYEWGMDYEIRHLTGEFDSFEREYYDMIRSTMLKYSLQARLGRMDGIFVAFHNIVRIFGFQYIPLEEMDESLHGQSDRCLGDQQFMIGLELMDKAFQKAVERFPNQSIRLHFETRDVSEPFMYAFAEPVSEDQVEEIQSTNRAKIEAWEVDLLGSETRTSAEKETDERQESSQNANLVDTSMPDGRHNILTHPAGLEQDITSELLPTETSYAAQSFPNKLTFSQRAREVSRLVRHVMNFMISMKTDLYQAEKDPYLAAHLSSLSSYARFNDETGLMNILVRARLTMKESTRVLSSILNHEKDLIFLLDNGIVHASTLLWLVHADVLYEARFAIWEVERKLSHLSDRSDHDLLNNEHCDSESEVKEEGGGISAPDPLTNVNSGAGYSSVEQPNSDQFSAYAGYTGQVEVDDMHTSGVGIDSTQTKHVEVKETGSTVETSDLEPSSCQDVTSRPTNQRPSANVHDPSASPQIDGPATRALEQDDASSPRKTTQGDKTDVAASSSTSDDSSDAADEFFLADAAPVNGSSRGDILAMMISVTSKVNETPVNRPNNLQPDDKWEVEYSFTEIASQARAWSLYDQLKERRKKVYTAVESVKDGKEQNFFRDAFWRSLRESTERGKEYRKDQDKIDADREKSGIKSDILESASYSANDQQSTCEQISTGSASIFSSSNTPKNASSKKANAYPKCQDPTPSTSKSTTAAASASTTRVRENVPESTLNLKPLKTEHELLAPPHGQITPIFYNSMLSHAFSLLKSDVRYAHVPYSALPRSIDWQETQQNISWSTLQSLNWPERILPFSRMMQCLHKICKERLSTSHRSTGGDTGQLPLLARRSPSEAMAQILVKSIAGGIRRCGSGPSEDGDKTIPSEHHTPTIESLLAFIGTEEHGSGSAQGLKAESERLRQQLRGSHQSFNGKQKEASSVGNKEEPRAESSDGLAAGKQSSSQHSKDLRLRLRTTRQLAQSRRVIERKLLAIAGLTSPVANRRRAHLRHALSAFNSELGTRSKHLAFSHTETMSVEASAVDKSTGEISRNNEFKQRDMADESTDAPRLNTSEERSSNATQGYTDIPSTDTAKEHTRAET